MTKFKIRFPCGLEIVEKGYGIELGTLNEDGILRYIKEHGCLIHGKKCNGIKSKE